MLSIKAENNKSPPIIGGLLNYILADGLKGVANADAACRAKPVIGYDGGKLYPEIYAAVILLKPVTNGAGSDKTGIIIKLEGCACCTAL